MDAKRLHPPGSGLLRGTASALALWIVSCGVGALLVAVASRAGAYGPAVVVSLVLVPMIAVGIFQAPLAGVAAVFATFPLGSLVSSLGPLPLQPVEAAVLIVSLFVAIRRLAHGLLPISWHPVLLWPLLLFVSTVLATPSALDRVLAVNQVLALAAGLLFAAVIKGVCRDQVTLTRMLAIFVGVAGAMAIFGLATASESQVAFGGAVVSGRAEGAFNQPNQLGSFSAMAAMVAAGLAFASRRKTSRVIAGSVSLCLLAALALSLSRGAWFGAALGGLYLMVAIPRARRAIGLSSIPLLLAIVSAAAFLPEVPQVEVVGARIQAFTADNPYDGRPEIWAEARREIVLDPWTGHGPGNFPVVSTRSGSEASTVFADHAHNLWLTWAAESGVPASLLILAFVVAVSVGVRRSRKSLLERGRDREAALIAGVAAAGITILGQGLVDYPLRNGVLWFTFWTLIGALVSSFVLARSYPAGSRETSSRKKTSPR